MRISLWLTHTDGRTDKHTDTGNDNQYLMASGKQGKFEGFDSWNRPNNLKLDSNHRFFSPCDLEIWWMTWKINRAFLLYYIKLCASFQIHQWIQTGVTVRKRSIRVEIEYLSRVTLKFDGWPWKTIGHLSYTTSSLVHHVKSIGEVKLELQSGNVQIGSNCWFFVPHDLEIWWITLKHNRAPLLYYIKLCTSLQSHGWIQTGVTVRKQSIRVKIGNFFVLCELQIWRMTLKINRAPLLWCFKHCARGVDIAVRLFSDCEIKICLNQALCIIS